MESNLKEQVLSYLDIDLEDIIISSITVNELMNIRKYQLKEGFDRMTCRPLMNRSQDSGIEWLKSNLFEPFKS